ncbi:putative mitochondrial chaperone BCS1-B [Madurella mycetomatis]|uniref:Mitochondrial chaperone BCS1-B n=1 Tax=Madurella mycetomatis TaxID=100816 RepID=A0A175VN64_9PEZI|nr:putative mitochondrial chaperone BCS1-B [Madurella mycetomatis]
MDLNDLIRGALPTLGTNATGGGCSNTSSSSSSSSSSGNSLPDGILESLTPLLGAAQFNPLLRLFMVLNNMAGSRFGLDPTFLLTIVGFVWAANKLWRQLYAAFYSLALHYFTVSIQISSTDDIYLHMMKWLASQPSMVNSRSLTAETASKGAWDEEEDLDLLSTRATAGASSTYLNFSTQEAKAAPRFTPALGLHNFWFRGRYYKLLRKQDSLYDDSAGHSGMPQFKDKETIVLSCFGRSPDPIKKLLQHAKERYYLDHQAKTTVKRPSAQAMRRYGSRHTWQQVASRPVRPMRTVVLDEEQKVKVLSDINEYLHPATPRWYANRGIPLRRGYLFHGPPGTGKTSLSFALAGVFGLDIFVISLLDPSLTEEDLSALFTTLPRRCVVLLEDIDTAGLTRVDDSASANDHQGAKGHDGTGKKADKTDYSRKEDWKVSDLARELKRHGDSGEKKGISLSGLLNAIDGVASHEGRVLIMTTNKPETLDEALIRPGRVDLQVAFTNATQGQARELFVRMYEADRKVTDDHLPLSSSPPPPLTPFSEPPPTPFSPTSEGEKEGSFTDFSSTTEVEEDTPGSPVTPNKPAPLNLDHGYDYGYTDLDLLQPAELARIATEFAAKIPSEQFSPAELQGVFIEEEEIAPEGASRSGCLGGGHVGPEGE